MLFGLFAIGLLAYCVFSNLHELLEPRNRSVNERGSKMTIGSALAIVLALTGASAVAQPAPPLAPQQAHDEELLVSPLSVYTPPTCVPGVPFADITCTTPFDPWIEQFALDGITAGCGGGNYCPGTPVTRDQMAVFIEKSMRGTANWPPHTVLVYHHPYGETNTDQNSGTELMSMVAAIPTSGSEAPSLWNPWSIKLGPGTWDLGSSTLILPAYVNMEGAGRQATIVYSSTSGGSAVLSISGGYATLARLAIWDYYSSGTEAHGIYVASAGDLELDDVDVEVAGNATYVVGVYASSSSVKMYNECHVEVTTVATGGAADAVFTTGSSSNTLTIHHSTLESFSHAINNAGGYSVYMAYSGLEGSLTNTSPGAYQCIGNYDSSGYSPVTCP